MTVDTQAGPVEDATKKAEFLAIFWAEVRTALRRSPGNRRGARLSIRRGGRGSDLAQMQPCGHVGARRGEWGAGKAICRG